MDMDKLREEVVSQLRCCLVSVKGKCDLRQIQSDFRMLMGSNIPYSRLGFSNLEEFIRSIPSLTTTTINGQLFVDAKPTEKSSHISNMIDKQQSKKRRAPARRPVFRPRNKFNNNRTNDPPRWRPNNLKRTYQSSPRPAAVSHNQFINTVSPQRPMAPSKISSRLVLPNETNKNEHVEKDLRLKLNNYKDREPIYKDREPIYKSETKVDEKITNGTDLVLKARKRIMAEALDKKNGPRVEENYVKKDITAMKKSPEYSISLSESVLLEESLNSSKNTIKSSIKSNNIPISRLSDSISRNQSVLLRESLSSKNMIKNIKSSNIPIAYISDVLEKKTVEADFTLTGDSLVDLQAFASWKDLGALDIKVKSRKEKRKTVFDCSIKVGLQSYSSYPEEFQREELAKQFVAKLALEDLTIKNNTKGETLLISHDADIMDRVPPIVKSHYHGVWNTQLEADYIETFNEQLPINWLEIVDLVESIEVVPSFTPNKYVLRCCKPGEKGTNGVAPLVFNVSVPSKTINFDDNNMLIAEITCVVSAAEIWCCQKETPDAEAFTDMCNKMEEYYNLYYEQEIADEIRVGGYYVVLNNGMWCRVRVIEESADGIHCFCIDFGDEWIVSKDTVYRLHRHFAREAAQAFVCRLAGVEELYEISKSADCLDNLVGKVVQVQLDTRNDNSAASSPKDPAVCVVFYDLESDDVINESLITAISIESAKPVLSSDAPTEVFVVHADNDGSVYVQVHSTGYNYLVSWLSDLKNDIVEGKYSYSNQNPTPEDSVNRLYFFENKEDNIWYRATINDWSPDRKYAQLLFVDYGKTAIVNVSETKLYPLDELSSIIDKVSHQAVVVQMALNNNIPNNFVEKISKLMPTDQPVLLKVVGMSPAKVPICNFFKRSETDNILFSINTAISIQDELQEFQNLSINEGNSSNGRSVKLQKLISLNQFDSSSKKFPSSGSLMSPPLPPPGAYYDIRVPCAVSPYNFFIQPYETQEQLSKLMSALQETCNSIPYSPLHIEEIQPGNIYASRHDDGKWYRTSVIKVIHAGSISVFYCDFGYYGNLTLQQLVPLGIEFTSLPYQAMKAKLEGIEPTNSNWTRDDCKYFEKLVCRKSFVSIFLSKETDDLYRYDTVLNLKLIDTSTAVDVYIDQILVERGIAKFRNDKKEQ